MAFGTVDVGGTERYGETNAGIEKDIVVREVASITPEDVGGDVSAVEGAHFGGGAGWEQIDGCSPSRSGRCPR